MRYVFHPEALIEFSEATIYHSEKNPKLGLAFHTEVENTIHRIIGTPRLFRIIEEDIRRCLAHRFPYGILYTIEEDYILIVAVMHCSREPSYWKHRVKKGKNKATYMPFTLQLLTKIYWYSLSKKGREV